MNGVQTHMLNFVVLWPVLLENVEFHMSGHAKDVGRAKGRLTLANSTGGHLSLPFTHNFFSEGRLLWNNRRNADGWCCRCQDFAVVET